MTLSAAREKQYALLSASGWRGVELDGLEIAADGRLELLRVPAVVEPVDLEPAAVAPSGLAVDSSRCTLFVSDAPAGRILRVALDCGERVALTFHGPPAGLCIGPRGWLVVADPDHGRVCVFAPPALTQRDEWPGLFAPVAVAWDGADAVYVLEAGPPPRIRRFDLFGRHGAVVAATMPRAIAVADDGTLYVADAAVGGVLRFASDGTVAGTPLAAGTDARALAVAGDRLLAADESTGRVLVFDRHDGRRLGAVAGFRGPVSALAADANGTIYLKTGGGPVYSVALPDRARVLRGTATTLTALDAGAEGAWVRAAADAEIAPGTSVALETKVDGEGWLQAPATDAYLPGARRLSLRVTLARADPAARAGDTPAVGELRAETEGEPYLDYLPSVYARDAVPASLLSRLLGLLRAVVDDREQAILDVPRSFDVATAPARNLPLVAAWQAFELPPAHALGDDERRDLLVELPRLYERAGRVTGIVRTAEIHTGIRPTLIEHYRSRGVWTLGGIAALGLDTVLPGAAPGGVTVGVDVVGAEAPERGDDRGAILFEETAHRFTAVVPAASLDDDGRRALARVLDAEKPAHTAYHLCAAEPRLRVGVQALLGLNAIVGSGRDAMTLDESVRLGLDARTASDPEDAPGAVGRRSRLGVDTLLA